MKKRIKKEEGESAEREGGGAAVPTNYRSEQILPTVLQ